ncbi:MAG: hypothetical protein S4CHLAM81_00590 [Chlamydiales bacterium]|nr:hypothetical protein [Chlamydiales bacterium]MCH9634861.1 hypothetical protein [Chlamydiales bacterium]MCH9704155.1 hypothetical protein [Chlamydiota bacterium]
MVSDAEKELVGALKQVMQMYDIKLDDEILKEAEGEEVIDYSEVISKTQDKIDELTMKAEEIYKKTGMSREELLEYASNPNNFTRSEWESLEQVREACDQMKNQTSHMLERPQKELERQKPASSKKQKRKFASKKNWLSG